MRFSSLITVVSVVVAGVSAVTVDLDMFNLFGVDITQNNFYGAGNPPWNGGSPGWYAGSDPFKYQGVYPCLFGFICKILQFFPGAIHCPPPPPPTLDGYYQTFYNLTGATQAADFLTFGLVDTIPECIAMCNGVTGCNFINSYHDVNGKGGSTQLTCSLFSLCHDSSTADNRGGQSQPNGSLDFIINSDGYCKIGVAISDSS